VTANNVGFTITLRQNNRWA